MWRLAWIVRTFARSVTVYRTLLQGVSQCIVHLCKKCHSVSCTFARSITVYRALLQEVSQCIVHLCKECHSVSCTFARSVTVYRAPLQGVSQCIVHLCKECHSVSCSNTSAVVDNFDYHRTMRLGYIVKLKPVNLFDVICISTLLLTIVS